MEPAAEVAELLGVESSIGTQRLTIGTASKDFLAGALSGMVGIAAGQPLDTLRVRLQQRGCQQASVAGVWRAMAGSEGVRGLFRGMSYPIYTTALQNAVTFQAQGAASRLLAGSVDRSTTVSWQHTCVAGMFAGAVQTCISSPVELLKIRLQLQQSLPGSAGYLGPLGMLRHVVSQEGVMGLSRGFGVTLLRDTPSYGLYFCTYHWMIQGLAYLQESTRAALQQHKQLQAAADALGHMQHQQQHVGLQPCSMQWAQAAPQQMQQQGPGSPPEGEQAAGAAEAAAGSGGSGGEPLLQFLAGGFAGAIAWASVYPLDVVKSRMQALPAGASPYRSSWHCAASSWQQEGVAAFSRGLGATMGRGFIVNAAIFASFEALMKAMADV